MDESQTHSFGFQDGVTDVRHVCAQYQQRSSLSLRIVIPYGYTTEVLVQVLSVVLRSSVTTTLVIASSLPTLLVLPGSNVKVSVVVKSGRRRICFVACDCRKLVQRFAFVQAKAFNVFIFKKVCVLGVFIIFALHWCYVFGTNCHPFSPVYLLLFSLA